MTMIQRRLDILCNVLIVTSSDAVLINGPRGHHKWVSHIEVLNVPHLLKMEEESEPETAPRGLHYKADTTRNWLHAVAGSVGILWNRRTEALSDSYVKTLWGDNSLPFDINVRGELCMYSLQSVSKISSSAIKDIVGRWHFQ
jgi:hypothetical protein